MRPPQPPPRQRRLGPVAGAKRKQKGKQKGKVERKQKGKQKGKVERKRKGKVERKGNKL